MSETKKEKDPGALLAAIAAARRVSTPLLAVGTPDQWATAQAVAEQPLPRRAEEGPSPKVLWDCVRGFSALNEGGTQVVAKAGEGQPSHPQGALEMAARFPEGTMLLCMNAHLFLREPGVTQAAANLRDAYKENRRTLVLLMPQVSLPPELTHDVVTFEEPLPSDEALGRLIGELHDGAGMAAPDAETTARATFAGRGLSLFEAEQVYSMALTRAGLDVGMVWERKRAAVSQVKGLTMTLGGERFKDVGGLRASREFGEALFRGPRPPRLVVRADEIEKMMAGASGPVGDSSGVQQDAHGVLLSAMEDNGWDGMMAVGPPGSGKTLFSKALGASNETPTLVLDLGAMRGQYVGQSEQAIRDAVRTIRGLAGDAAFFVATCNKLESLSPELRRRFRSGVWFFDLPDLEERLAIWRLCLRHYGLAEDLAAVPKDELPDDSDWTGAEIRNCCERAWLLRCSLRRASAYVVPVAKADPEGVERLRGLASGRFLSASRVDPETGGAATYQRPDGSAPRRGLRDIDVGGSVMVAVAVMPDPPTASATLPRKKTTRGES